MSNPLLRISSQSNMLDIIKHIENGADLNACDDNGNTPLMLAAAGGHENYVTVFLERGANHLAKNNDGKTALDLARSASIRVQLDFCAASIADTFDGTHTSESLKASARQTTQIIAELEKADQAARRRAFDFSAQTCVPLRVRPPLRFKK